MVEMKAAKSGVCICVMLSMLSVMQQERSSRTLLELIKEPMAFRNKWLNAVLRREEDLLIYENYLRRTHKIRFGRNTILDGTSKLALMMFTSCGWFFDTANGLEPVQILRYAKRLIEITKTRVDNGFENAFWEELYKIFKEENGQWSGEEMEPDCLGAPV